MGVPVIERIAQGLRHGRGFEQALNFLEWTGVPGAETFRDAVGAHGPPLVMVTFEPDFGQVVEAAVGGDISGRQMAVVVENRLGLGVAVVEAARRPGVQEKDFIV